jgi:segregation and condensation protein B
METTGGTVGEETVEVPVEAAAEGESTPRLRRRRDGKEGDAAETNEAGEPAEEPGDASGGLWPVERLAPVLEAVVFAAADPLPVRRMKDVVEGATTAEIKAALGELQRECAHRGVRLVEVAGGWQFRTAPEQHDVVKRLFKERPFRLTRAGIETLAVVAYRQPVTRAEIEAIRGVDVSGVLESLLERRMIRVAGRRDVPGRPLVYTTTQEFLEMFGLKDLRSLPTLAELGDDLQNMADQSGFSDAGERDAAILPVDAVDTVENSGGDQDEATRTAETADRAGEAPDQTEGE